MRTQLESPTTPNRPEQRHHQLQLRQGRVYIERGREIEREREKCEIEGGRQKVEGALHHYMLISYIWADSTLFTIRICILSAETTARRLASISCFSWMKGLHNHVRLVRLPATCEFNFDQLIDRHSTLSQHLHPNSCSQAITLRSSFKFQNFPL